MSFKSPSPSPTPAAGVPAAHPTAIRLEIASRTDVGKVRSGNEDRSLVAHLGRGERSIGDFEGVADASRGGMILAVCDGMGGEAGGEIASSATVEALFASLARTGPVVDSSTLGRRIVSGLGEAAAKIQEIAAREPRLRGMGTTATVAGIVDERVVVAQVGDSRAYLVRDGRIERLTRDQTLVELLLQQGQLTPEQAKSCDYGHVILQAVGCSKQLDVALDSYELRAGDVLVVCSDGLSGVVADDEIRAQVTSATSAAQACQRMVELALERGAPDNVTCIVARASGEGLA